MARYRIRQISPNNAFVIQKKGLFGWYTPLRWLGLRDLDEAEAALKEIKRKATFKKTTYKEIKV